MFVLPDGTRLYDIWTCVSEKGCGFRKETFVASKSRRNNPPETLGEAGSIPAFEKAGIDWALCYWIVTWYW